MSSKKTEIINRLKELANPDIATHSQRFFKTGKGEYGEGDKFLGIRVPVLRKCAREHGELSLKDILELLRSPFHETRLVSLLIMIAKYSKSSSAERDLIYRSYLGNTKYINNWDLVDCSAEHIVGAHLFDGDRKSLYKLARSKDLWERRISIMSTFYFIKRDDFTDTMHIAELLLSDKEDLIHKASGWMLREIGKRNLKTEESFLIKHYRDMPRVMLRYAIEKFPESERRAYLYGTKK
jgi:3-methyladenine DNA glycosylase AlkD